MVMAIALGKSQFVEVLLDNKIDIFSPPEKIEGLTLYQKTPYIIMAVASGNKKTINTFLRAGANIEELGCICFSENNKNAVISNVIGAATYFGHDKILPGLLELFPKGIDFPAQEMANAKSE